MFAKVIGSMFCACPAFPAFFSYYNGSTKCSTVVQVPWLPEVTKGHVTPSGFPWVCAYTTGNYAISDLVGPFDWKWRYETSPRSDRRSLEGCGRLCACATRGCAISALVGSFHRKCILECSLRRPRLSFSSPGYLPLLFSYNISIMVYTYGVFAWNTCIVTCIY
jgi:hypothetical protein